jgi:hypothetical protein
MRVSALAEYQAIYKIAQAACNDNKQRKLRQAGITDLTPDVVAAFGYYFTRSKADQRQALNLIKLAKKLKALVTFFAGKGKALWVKFKALLGVDKLTQLRPKHIAALAKKGHAVLKGAFHKAFSHWPLKLFTLDKGKLLGVNDLINKLMEKHPRFKNWLQTKVKPKVDQLDAWLRKYLPGISHVALVAIYFWIWMNVVEFEWDLNALGQVLMGNLTLGDLLASLPGSILGALMNGFGFGTFTLLPAITAARIIYLLAHNYLEYKNNKFQLAPNAVFD